MWMKSGGISGKRERKSIKFVGTEICHTFVLTKLLDKIVVRK